MPIRASRPMSPGAAMAANDSFYRAHPEMVKGGKRVPLDPCNPKHAPYRDQWMKSYAANGGKTEPSRGNDQVCSIQEVKVKAKKVPKKKVGKVQTDCPQRVATQPPVLPPPQKKPTPGKKCKLTAFTMTCEHGRSAGPQGILMVVPDSTASLGDTVKGQMKFEGGCGEHPSWSIGGYLTKRGNGALFDFWAQSVRPSVTGFAGLQNVSPQKYSVNGQSCAGGRNYQVHAYPPGKVVYKVDFEAWRKKFREFLGYLPVKPAEVSKWEGKILRGSLEYNGSWKEDPGSWQAFYEKSLAGGFDPLLGLSYKDQLYPPNLMPAKLREYLEAGLFFEIGGAFKFAVNYKAKYWPATGKQDTGEWTVSASGGLEGTLSIELKLVDKDVVEAGVFGSTGVAIEAEKALGGGASVECKLKWDGLKGKFSVKALWGWVEFAREYQLVAAREWPLNKNLENAK
jgi:hypothetical protein